MSFEISNRMFGLDSVKEAGLILCKREEYIDDPKQALKERRALKKFNGFLWLFRSPYDIEHGIP
ncbi:MAG: hypothetical protein H8E62_05310 [Planctomycetes bacterium]|nr:hypothetical protein [Planctomycetota bacterium]